MRIIKINIDDITFDYCKYQDSTKQSIQRIGLSFPIKVNITDKGYQCIDGHKRLSIIQDLLKQEQCLHLKDVPAIIINNENNRSNDCWRGRNSH